MQVQTEPLIANTSKPKGRWVLLLLVAFFAVPLLLVMLMHHFDWHPQSNSQGQLITPPRLLQTPAQLLDVRGLPIQPDFWRDKWSMVYIADDCEQMCADRLHSMRQLHVSLAKDINRVQRVFLTTSSNLEGIQKQYPDLIILNQPADALKSLTQQFDLPDAPAGKTARIYLVDPLGYLMMSYPTTIPPAAIRKDLTRLLTYAWAG